MQNVKCCDVRPEEVLSGRWHITTSACQVSQLIPVYLAQRSTLNLHDSQAGSVSDSCADGSHAISRDGCFGRACAPEIPAYQAKVNLLSSERCTHLWTVETALPSNESPLDRLQS